MIKKISLLVTVLVIQACGELQGVVNQLPGGGGLTTAEIASGLRQALDLGINRQVSRLAVEDGFYGNALVRIGLPAELQKVDRGLRNAGLGDLADEGLKILNRAAEDAVGEAIPIFAQAVKGITFADARDILLGEDDAATRYLDRATSAPLYEKFHPIISDSFRKVGADKLWANLIGRYNALPFTEDVNPDLPDYVTGEALKGVYAMIAVEEKEIRNSIASRTTDLLRKVFALQD